MVNALIKGERSAEELTKFIHGRTINRHGRPTLLDSLEGDVSQSDIDMLVQYTQMQDIYNM